MRALASWTAPALWRSPEPAGAPYGSCGIRVFILSSGKIRNSLFSQRDVIIQVSQQTDAGRAEGHDDEVRATGGGVGKSGGKAERIAVANRSSCAAKIVIYIRVAGDAERGRDEAGRSVRGLAGIRKNVECFQAIVVGVGGSKQGCVLSLGVV